MSPIELSWTAKKGAKNPGRGRPPPPPPLIRAMPERKRFFLQLTSSLMGTIYFVQCWKRNIIFLTYADADFTVFSLFQIPIRCSLASVPSGSESPRPQTGCSRATGRSAGSPLCPGGPFCRHWRFQNERNVLMPSQEVLTAPYILNWTKAVINLIWFWKVHYRNIMI